MAVQTITPPGAWSALAFREAIRFAMEMGKAVVPTEAPIFEFEPVVTYPPGTALDLGGRPLDPTIAPTVTVPPAFTFTSPYGCAVEVDVPAIGAFDELEPGVVRRIRAVITMLDEEHTQLLAAGNPKWVRLGGDRYLILMTLPTLGLFDVGVYQFVCGSTEED